MKEGTRKRESVGLHLDTRWQLSHAWVTRGWELSVKGGEKHTHMIFLFHLLARILLLSYTLCYSPSLLLTHSHTQSRNT